MDSGYVDNLLIGVIFGSVGVLILGMFVYNTMQRYGTKGNTFEFNDITEGNESRDICEAKIDRVEQQEHILADELLLFVDNLKFQLNIFLGYFNLYKFLKKGENKQKNMEYVTIDIFSLVFTFGIVAGVAIMFGGLLQQGALVYIINLNLLVMFRQRIYFKRRMYFTRNALLHLKIYNTQYKKFDLNILNVVQVLVILMEVLLLCWYPVRQIIDVYGSFDEGGLNRFLSLITSKVYLVLMYGCLSIHGALVLTLVLIYMLRKRLLFLIYFLVPVVNLLYLPTLVIYLSSISCNTNILLEKRHGSPIDPSRFRIGVLNCAVENNLSLLVVSLLAYTVFYIIFTIFSCCYEYLPRKGEIQFKSFGVAFLKNQSLVMSIIYLLLSRDYSPFQSLFSMATIISMVCFNIRTHPCYVSSINLFRTCGYCCILWGFLLSTSLYNSVDESPISVISESVVYSGLGIGMAVVCFLFTTFSFIA